MQKETSIEKLPLPDLYSAFKYNRYILLNKLYGISIYGNHSDNTCCLNGWIVFYVINSAACPFASFGHGVRNVNFGNFGMEHL